MKGNIFIGYLLIIIFFGAICLGIMLAIDEFAWWDTEIVKVMFSNYAAQTTPVCPPGTVVNTSPGGYLSWEWCQPVQPTEQVTVEPDKPSMNVVFPGASPDGQIHCYTAGTDGVYNI